MNTPPDGCTHRVEMSPPLRPDGFRRAKWATFGVMLSTVVFFLVPVSLGWPGAPLHLMGTLFGFAMHWLEGCTLGGGAARAPGGPGCLLCARREQRHPARADAAAAIATDDRTVTIAATAATDGGGRNGGR